MIQRFSDADQGCIGRKRKINDSEMQRFRASGLSERERIESDAEMQRCREIDRDAELDPRFLLSCRASYLDTGCVSCLS